MKNFRNKQIVILTGLPFRKQGNQSLSRFVNMFLKENISVTMFSAGNDPKGENVIEDPRFVLYKVKSLEIALTNFLNKLLITKNKEKVSKENHFLNIKSEDILPPYGNYTVATLLNKWLKYILSIFDNICLFFYIVLFKNKELRNSNAIIAYEVNYGLSAKWLSRLFKKKYINKYQGTILKATNRNKSLALKYFPHNYFGINASDLCLMVQDGTDGEYYARLRGCKNIFFEPHGVLEYKESGEESKLLEDFKDKFILFNNASGSTWKRPDRIIRGLLKIDKKILDNVVLLTTYYAADREELIDFVNKKRLQDKVIFLEKLDNNQSNYILRHSDVLIMTNDFSNLGNPILEAIYYKVPIISINDGSLKGFLKDEFDSFLIDLNDKFDSNMALAIEKLYKDKKLYSKIKNNLNNEKQVRELSEQQEREFKVINTLL